MSDYIKSIRNTRKKAYAIKYLEFLCNGGKEPERGDLSYMAAQAVRMNLDRNHRCVTGRYGK